MFHFITKWFSKGKSEADGEEIVQKEYQWGDPVPQSFDFTGADELRVSAVDCARDNVTAVEWSIHDPKRLTEIRELIEELNVDGVVEQETNRCLRHTVTAYQEKKPFAKVRLYNGKLQLQNSKFIVSDEDFLRDQATLLKLLKIDRSKPE